MAVIITCTGTDASAQNVGWYQPIVPAALAPYLYSLHLFGTAYPPALGTGVSNQDRADYSLNGRTLTKTGSALSTNYFTSSASTYYDAPYNADALSATSGGLSLCTVARLPNALSLPISSDAGNAAKAVGIGNGNSTYQGVASQTGLNIVANLAHDANTGALFDFLLMTADASFLNLYRRNSAGANQTAPSVSTTLHPGGTTNLRMGDAINSAFTGANLTALACAFTRVVTPTEKDALYLSLQTFLAIYSILI